MKKGTKVAGKKGSRGSGYQTSINWEPIKLALCAGQCTFAEAAATFGVKENTLYVRAKRDHWPIPKRILELSKNNATAVALGNISRERIDKHISTTFDIASKSVAKFRPRAPKTFKELDTADRIVRRAAGLKDDQPIVATMIKINEAINSHDPSQQPIEATVIPGNHAALQQGDMAAGQQGIRDAEVAPSNAS